MSDVIRPGFAIDIGFFLACYTILDPLGLNVFILYCSLTSDSGGIVPTHSIKKLKSIFNEKNEPIPGGASTPATPATTPNVQDIPSSKVRFSK